VSERLPLHTRARAALAERVQTEPLVHAGVVRGVHQIMATQEEMYPTTSRLYLLFSSSIERLGPQVGERFLVAYLRGARDYYDAMRGGPKRKHVIDVLMKYTSLKDPAQYDKIQWEYVDPNIEFNVESMQDQEDWYAAQGAVTKKVPIESMIDRRFVDYAVGKLGRIPVK